MSQFNEGWYVLYTRCRHEKKVVEQLERLGVEHFLPYARSIRQRCDRKKLVVAPLFPSYVFVKLQALKKYFESMDIDGVLYFLKTGKEIARVSESVIRNIRLLVENAAELEVSSELFCLGRKLIISDGPFTGLECEVVEHRGCDKLLVKVAILNRNILLKKQTSELLPAAVCPV